MSATRHHAGSMTRHGGSRAAGERGEGVISAAIAVLIMAALGVVMWVGFQEIWSEAKENTRSEVTRIGS